MKGFALGLALKQRQKTTRKWSIRTVCSRLLRQQKVLRWCCGIGICGRGHVALINATRRYSRSVEAGDENINLLLHLFIYLFIYYESFMMKSTFIYLLAHSLIHLFTLSRIHLLYVIYLFVRLILFICSSNIICSFV